MAAFQTSQVSVGTTAVPLVSGLEGRFQLVVQTESPGGDEIWIGDSTVAVGTGIRLDGNSITILEVLLDSTDALYGISNTVNVGVWVMVNPR